MKSAVDRNKEIEAAYEEWKISYAEEVKESLILMGADEPEAEAAKGMILSEKEIAAAELKRYEPTEEDYLIIGLDFIGGYKNEKNNR